MRFRPLASALKALLRPISTSQAISSTPVTHLAASAPFDPKAKPLSSVRRDATTDAATDAVRTEFARVASVNPGLTWPRFLAMLTDDLRMHRAERTARESRLADLQRAMKKLP